MLAPLLMSVSSTGCPAGTVSVAGASVNALAVSVAVTVSRVTCADAVPD
jgi:hypothetical protein